MKAQYFKFHTAITVSLFLWTLTAMGISHQGTDPSLPPPVQKPTEETKEKEEKVKWWEITSAIGTAAAAWFAYLATKQTKEAAERTERAERAQRLADLWADMGKLTYLSEAQKNSLDKEAGSLVRENVNTLEKVAFLWNADLVDRARLEQEIWKGFILLYEQTIGLGKIESLNRTGTELISENPLSTTFYNYLKKRHP
jgi:hypothetical protein